MKYICSICIFLCLYSCKQKNDDERNGVPLINVRSLISDAPEEIPISEIGNKIRYIKLETKPTCLLNKITTLQIANNNLFVSNGKVLYQFDLKGKFVRQIGKKGKGPGEHSKKIRFTIDESTSEIYMFSRRPGYINIYDLETGLYKRVIRFKFDVTALEVFSPGIMALATTGLSKEMKDYTLNELYISDNYGNLLDSVINIERQNVRGNFLEGYLLYNGEEGFNYIGYNNGLLTNVDKDFNVHFRLKLDFENKIKYENVVVEPGLNEELKDYLLLSKIVEDKDCIYLNIMKRFSTPWENYRMMYEKTKGNLRICNAFINNLDYGMEFWPKFTGKNTLIDYYTADEISKYLEDNNNSENFPNILKSINISDNPVIAILE